MPAPGEFVVEIVEAHPRLDHADAALLVDLVNAPEPGKVDHHRPRLDRCSAAIAEVLAARDRPERDLVHVGGQHHFAQFLDRARGHRARRFMAGKIEAHLIAVGLPVLLARMDAVGTDNLRNRFQERGDLVPIYIHSAVLHGNFTPHPSGDK
ncbi:hypothetical protein MBENS4_2482 [Novosphingobium sp. MBES04]|nr:hypothetical protein MBENS4_2482 [Novosphingobium sp. MBES04]